MSSGESGFFLTINGAAVPAARSMDVVNPATGAVFARAPNAGAAELEAAIAAARAAFPKWKATSAATRAAAVVKAAEVLGANAEALAQIMVAEHGRPVELCKQEIFGAAYWMQALAGIEIPVDITEDTPERRVEVHREPLGLVAALIPWNFPILLAAWKLAHALLTGNVLVLKPSPFTPLATLKLGALLAPLFPPGVLNVLSGDDALGPLMTAHPAFAKITFTGSSATGRRIMAAAAKDLKRLTLEMGGNDAAIVLPDVDVAKVAPRLFQGAFINTAQVCVATKRLYAHEAVYDELRARLHALALAAKVGDGAAQGTEFGPIQNKPQYERVQAMLARARAQGLTLLQGAPVPDGGYFVPLTLVDNPPEESAVVREEAFGPILPLLKYSDLDEVIARANDSEYGLAATVWTADIALGEQLAARLDVGTVWINDNLNSSPVTPLTGHKQSGFGVENGLAGLLEFTQIKAIFIPKTGAA